MIKWKWVVPFMIWPPTVGLHAAMIEATDRAPLIEARIGTVFFALVWTVVFLAAGRPWEADRNDGR